MPAGLHAHQSNWMWRFCAPSGNRSRDAGMLPCALMLARDAAVLRANRPTDLIERFPPPPSLEKRPPQLPSRAVSLLRND